MQKLTIDDVRPEVITFAIKMERKLRENDHKGGWLNDCYDYLITRLEDEVEELKIAYKKGNGVLTGIASECCDIANYAMMINDKYERDVNHWLTSERQEEQPDNPIPSARTTLNLSDRVTSEDCAGCGYCCETFEIWYPAPDENQWTDIIRSEIKRLQMLSRFGRLITTRSNDDGSTWVVFNIPCRYLQPDKSCSIYYHPERLLLCRCFPFSSSTKEDCPKLMGD